MIETLEDWNTRLGYCGCCPMPECFGPDMKFQQKTGSYYKGLVAPFTDPGIADSDEMPTLYETRSNYTGSILSDGVVSDYFPWSFRPGYIVPYQEDLEEYIYTNDGEQTTTVHTFIYNESTSPTYTPCTPGSVSYPPTVGGGSRPAAATATPIGPDTYTCTATSWRALRDRIHYTRGTERTGLRGCGNGGFDENHYIDLVTEDLTKRTLSDPVTKAQAFIEAKGLIDEEEWGSPIIGQFQRTALRVKKLGPRENLL